MPETDIVPVERHYETASATTDPDNANSGGFAYALTAGVLAVMVALLLALSGPVGFLVGQRLYDYGSAGSGGLELDWDADPPSSGTDDSGQTADELSLSEALDLDLAPYYLTVDDGVKATDYAGVPDDVRTYVRDVLSADSKAQQEVASLLNAAARSDDAASQMQAVADAANSGREAIESLDVPALADATVSADLAEAHQATLERWDAIVAELEILSQGASADSPIPLSDLQEADDGVSEKTDEAAEDFTEALQAAGGH